MRFLEHHTEANDLMRSLIGDGWMESGADMLYGDHDSLLRNWFMFTYGEQMEQIQTAYPDAILHYEYSGLDFNDGISGALYAVWLRINSSGLQP